jgi:hypothetical protein
LKGILDKRVTSVNAAAALLEGSRVGKDDLKVGHANAKDRKDLRLISKATEPHVATNQAFFAPTNTMRSIFPRKATKQTYSLISAQCDHSIVATGNICQSERFYA